MNFGKVGNGKLGRKGVGLRFLKRWAKTAQ